MSLHEFDKVDYLSLDRVGGCLVLTISDDFDWDDEKVHLHFLQRKINRYFDFIESGEIWTQLEEGVELELGRNTPIKISVILKYSPTFEGVRFFNYVKGVANESGIDFSYRTLAD